METAAVAEAMMKMDGGASDGVGDANSVEAAPSGVAPPGGGGIDQEVISKPFAIHRRSTPPNIYITGSVNGEPNRWVAACSANTSKHFAIIIDKLLEELNGPTCVVYTKADAKFFVQQLIQNMV